MLKLHFSFCPNQTCSICDKVQFAARWEQQLMQCASTSLKTTRHTFDFVVIRSYHMYYVISQLGFWDFKEPQSETFKKQKSYTITPYLHPNGTY